MLDRLCGCTGNVRWACAGRAHLGLKGEKKTRTEAGECEPYLWQRSRAVEHAQQFPSCYISAKCASSAGVDSLSSRLNIAPLLSLLPTRPPRLDGSAYFRTHREPPQTHLRSPQHPPSPSPRLDFPPVPPSSCLFPRPRKARSSSAARLWTSTDAPPTMQASSFYQPSEQRLSAPPRTAFVAPPPAPSR